MSTHVHRTIWIAALVLAAALASTSTIILLVRAGSHSGSSPGAQSTVGSGVAAVQSRHVGAFTGVELAGSNNLTIRVGGRQSVVVHADDNLLRKVTTQVRGGRLVVDDTGSFRTTSPMEVDVTVPSLDTLVLSGSGNVVATAIAAKRLTATLPGSGTMTATGTVVRLDAALDGSGDMQLGGLAARAVHADLAGSGQIVVDATDSLDAVVGGSGTILNLGHPAHVTKSVTGSGAIAGG